MIGIVSFLGCDDGMFMVVVFSFRDISFFVITKQYIC